MTLEKFDVFVIGTGIAGQTVAKECVTSGLRVGIADNREYGGVCANRGCDPKKIILGITEVINATQKLYGKGVLKVPEISWKDTMKFKRSFTDAIPLNTEEDLSKLGIVQFHQSPKFLDELTLSVEGKRIEANKIVIASGLVPRELNIKGETLALLSDDFLTLPELPKSMVFIGAGYIGMEFAHMAARFGVKVTIIDSGDRPLKAFDKWIISQITKASEKLGIKFIFNAKVSEIEELRKNKRVYFTKANKRHSIKARLIFNTSGRVPSIQDLKLKNGNVSFCKKGIEVNSYLQNSTNKNIYACGDVANNSLPLTPFSSREGKIVAHNIIHGNQQQAIFPVTPSTVFTIPQLASVGLSEEEAKSNYKNIVVKQKDISYAYNSKRLNEPIYAYKTLVDKDTDLILGACIVGPEANEIINLFAICINQKITTKEFKKTIFTYPSWCGDAPYMV